MFHAAMLLWVTGMAYLIHGDVNTHAMAWLLVGSIPGVLIGSQIGVKVPERGLRIALRLRADPVRDQGLRRAEGDLRDRGRTSFGALVLMVWGIRRLFIRRVAARTRHRIAGVWPGSSRSRSSSRCSRAPAGAFALTEHSSWRKSPIYGTKVSPQTFSPECNCDKSAVTLFFRLRKRDNLTVWMERDGERKRTLVSGRSYPAGPVTARVRRPRRDRPDACPTGLTGPSSASGAITGRSSFRTGSSSTRSRPR